MTWASALKRQAESVFDDRPSQAFTKPTFKPHVVDWARLVCIDYETFYDADYTLKKLSTSEYIRDSRFKAQMLGIKVGNGKTRIIPAKQIRAELAKINWSTHAVLCHNTQFDGFILSHHFGVHPAFLYDSLSMARGLHSNDIGASLDEVSVYYGGHGKIAGALEQTLGVRDWSKTLFNSTAIYCANDVDEMFRVFKAMLPSMPDDEMRLIDMITRMFTSPILKVDIPRVEAELKRELDRRDVLMASVINPALYYADKTVLKSNVERELTGKERDNLVVKRVIGSNEKFAALLRAEGIEPPVKISPAWIKKPKDLRDDEGKWAYAFAKDDAKFVELPNRIDDWGFDLSKPAQVKLMAVKQARIQTLVDVRIATKSTTNITRAQRFLTAGADGMALPCGYAYYRAHTGRLGGNNKMNMQNLTRGGELRLSILAPAGHQIVVQDSGQIECVAHDSPVLTRDRGCVTIQNIQLSDLLWDGVEWVAHDGVVCTGYKEVITYDGVTATPNHKVWLQDGSTCTLEDIQKSKTRQGLAVGSLRGKAVRFLDSDERTHTAWGNTKTDMPMLRMPEEFSGSTPRYAEWQINTMQELRRKAVKKFDSAWAQVRRYLAKVQRPNASELDDIWRARNQMPIQLARGVHILDGRKSPTQRLHGGGDRPQRQRWTLRAGQSAPCNTAGECEQQANHGHGPVRWETRTENCVYGAASRVWLWLGCNWRARAQRAGWGANNSPVHDSVQKSLVYDILNAGPRYRFTASDRIVSNCRVNGWLWGQNDLMDAFKGADQGIGRDAYCNFADHIYGREITKADKMERHVGKTAVLGLGYQMGAAKFQLTLAKGALGGPPVYFPLDQCKTIVNTYRRQNHKIQTGWGICKQIIEDMAAGREGSFGPISWEYETVWLPNGMALKYPNLRKTANEDNGWDEWSYQAKDMRKKIYGGLLCENIVQALARIIVMWQSLQINGKYRVVMSTHDEAVAIAKTSQAQRCLDFMAKWMSTAPAWCSDIPLNCEGGFDVRYSK